MIDTTQELIKLADMLGLDSVITDKTVDFYYKDCTDRETSQELTKTVFITKYQSVVSYMTYCHIPCSDSKELDTEVLQKLDFGGDIIQCTIYADNIDDDLVYSFNEKGTVKFVGVANGEHYSISMSLKDLFITLGMSNDEMKKELGSQLDEDGYIELLDSESVWNRVQQLTAPDIQYVYLRSLCK